MAEMRRNIKKNCFSFPNLRFNSHETKKKYETNKTKQKKNAKNSFTFTESITAEIITIKLTIQCYYRW
jgi:hypothetical protein